MATTSFSHSSEEQQQKEEEGVKETTAIEKERECVHKTKTIQFLGRTTPIVLQNDNGPCPLLAICNVLLLRNNLNLSPDISEVSQEKLLSLVAERLIDSNSNVNNKDAGYVENQQQNIADAIDLLPRLATGIDVNIKFRRIDDFEFTRECAIFDLLDIPLYHGWIVDPQDYETANAIGSKSYNTLMGELVDLETRYMEAASKHPDEECVDFAAATAAALGVPSPNLSKTRSFDESPRSLSDQQKETKWDPEEQTKTSEGLDLSADDSPYQITDHPKARKGDLEEEAQLVEILKLSEAEAQTSVGDSFVSSEREEDISSGSNDGTAKVSNFAEPVYPEKKLEEHINNNDHHRALSNQNQSQIALETNPAENLFSSLENDQNNNHDMSTYTQSAHSAKQDSCTDDVKLDTAGTLVHSEAAPALSSKENAASVSEGVTDVSQGEKVEKVGSHAVFGEGVPEAESVHDQTEASCLSVQSRESDTSSGKVQNLDTHDASTSSVDVSEPIYEGEECILDSGNSVHENREPMYEGEVLLAEQADKTVRSKDAISPQQGELIKNFLKNTASQLAFYGLFCLQDGLKERELCVFFRNNHFSTMFKYDGELYLLATDQGYLNQPDLVWEKLNEVNGDTLFMTGNFKEFKVEDHQANGTWDEQNAMASTADYLASLDGSQAHLDMNSDFQLAMALQQQEFEQQQQPQGHSGQQQPQGHSGQQQPPSSHSGQQPPSTGTSRLITGPQVRRSSPKASSSSRSDAKSKEKCIVM